MAAEVLTERALNRATLARQLLLERSTLTPAAAIEHLVGLQSQTTRSWYTGLWSRLVDFDPVVVGDGIEQRELVRIATMRSTIHLHTARDALFFRPLVQSVSERMLRSSFGRYLGDLDIDEIASAARPLLSGEPVTLGSVGAQLAERWESRQPLALSQVARVRLALVQTPPRGVWGKSGLARHATVESWLGRSVDENPSLEAMVARYLRAFGPVSVMDLQAWCGLTKLGEIVDGMRPELRFFRNGDGRELVDLPDAPRPEEDTPAPVRFLYDYDNILISFADRRRMGRHDLLALGWSADGPQPSCVLVDGRVKATWLLETAPRSATVTVTPLEKLTRADRAAIESEGMGLIGFAAAGSESREVRIGT